MSDQTTPKDPTSQYPQPDQPAESIEHPGLTTEMPQKPDQGEETYRGSGRLKGKRAIIAGGDSGIGCAEAQCQAVVDAAVRHGGTEIVVNSAAYQMAQVGGLADITTAQFDRVINANQYGFFG